MFPIPTTYLSTMGLSFWVHYNMGRPAPPPDPPLLLYIYVNIKTKIIKNKYIFNLSPFVLIHLYKTLKHNVIISQIVFLMF